MSFIDRINNRELGGTVRGKINQVIDVLNNIEEFLPPGPHGQPGPQGVPGPGVQVLLNLIGFGTDVGDLPAFANNGDTFLIRTTDEEDGDPIAQVYIFGSGARGNSTVPGGTGITGQGNTGGNETLQLTKNFRLGGGNGNTETSDNATAGAPNTGGGGGCGHYDAGAGN